MLKIYKTSVLTYYKGFPNIKKTIKIIHNNILDYTIVADSLAIIRVFNNQTSARDKMNIV